MSRIQRSRGFGEDAIYKLTFYITSHYITVRVCVSQDTTVKVWDVITGSELHSLGGHRQTVTAVLLLSTELSTHLGQCNIAFVASVSLFCYMTNCELLH